jgi:hypothetical protein
VGIDFVGDRLVARARLHAERYRQANDYDGSDQFDHRHEDWARWTRRAAQAHARTTALGMAVEQVVVTDDLGEGPCRTALSSAAPVLIPDMRSTETHQQWPRFGRETASLNVGALFAFPMLIGISGLGSWTATTSRHSRPRYEWGPRLRVCPGLRRIRRSGSRCRRRTWWLRRR